MKGKDFARLLADFSDVLRDACAHEQAAGWRALVRVFEATPSLSVSAICSELSGVQAPEHTRGLRLQQMLSLLPALKRFLVRTSAKKAAVEDLATVEAALAPFSRTPAETLADAAIAHLLEQPATQVHARAAARDDLLQNYLERLEAALNDETRFELVFNELKNDASISPAEAKKLSRAFAKETAKSKAAALDLIWGRHAALMGSRARQQANTGRTAA